MMGPLKNGTLFRLVSAGILLMASGLQFLWAMKRPQDYARWYPAFSRKVAGWLARLFAPGLFSWGEILLYLSLAALLVYIVFTVFVGIREKRLAARSLRFLSVALFYVSALLFAFLSLWGLNYFAPSLADTMNLEVRQRPVAALTATAFEVRDALCDLAAEVPRGSDGVCELGDFADVRKLMGDESPWPKKVLNWQLMSKVGISGIYSPWTGEANVNPDTPDATLPFTMAHEMAHRAGVAPEDEANFQAYLTCRSHESPHVRYSGYLVAFIYLSNALGNVSPDAQYDLWVDLDPVILNDLSGLAEHYAKYQGAIQETGEKLNDTYLKVMRQEDGVQSYGRVADLLIAEYVARHGEVDAY